MFNTSCIVLYSLREIKLCYVMLCYVMLCYVMLCCVALCCVVLCCVVLCCVVLCCVVLCCVVLCCVVLCCVVLCHSRRTGHAVSVTRCSDTTLVAVTRHDQCYTIKIFDTTGKFIGHRINAHVPSIS